MKTSPHLVAVYGTLRKGGRIHDQYMTGATYVDSGIVPGYRMLDLRRGPGAVIGEADQRIVAEVYEVDDRHLARLDRCEGHPTFYRRTPVPFHGSDGTKPTVDLYVWQRVRRDMESGLVIDSGDWMAHYEANKAAIDDEHTRAMKGLAP